MASLILLAVAVRCARGLVEGNPVGGQRLMFGLTSLRARRAAALRLSRRARSRCRQGHP
jgi:hypothetical protein